MNTNLMIEFGFNMIKHDIKMIAPCKVNCKQKRRC